MTLSEFIEKNKEIPRWDAEIIEVAGIAPPLKVWQERNFLGLPLKHRIFKKLFDHNIIKEPLDYFEFGVWAGTSTWIMSHLLGSPHSRIYGFDTFTGLPEDWCVNGVVVAPKNTFYINNVTPTERGLIYDKRCAFFKGLVQDTLPKVLESYNNRRKFVNLDLDLFSGTWSVLDTLAGFFLPGDIVMFDEFTFEEHEYRAYEEYVRTYGDNLKLIGRSFNQFVFVVK